ncbi:hypothetical protein GGTG_07517 [Gaeumannomyces tritici R3-111a-1]|uniref:Uncharacterized protein n=1 Tax=Gaeumannomyces tritici (strain R3-111a-1) TaxID=644352 RepID=J3P1W9_GAET3|nr:hypothetical protein GGTG_07517 [Gaeumannomyces tritici R3-111a-1]EJT73661.1 hypothetical protein GGTG_07517 [Gaeumannomyces tritici R3-111a-1]
MVVVVARQMKLFTRSVICPNANGRREKGKDVRGSRAASPEVAGLSGWSSAVKAVGPSVGRENGRRRHPARDVVRKVSSMSRRGWKKGKGGDLRGSRAASPGVPDVSGSSIGRSSFGCYAGLGALFGSV